MPMTLIEQLRTQSQQQNVMAGLRDELSLEKPHEKRIESLMAAAREYGVPESQIQRVRGERKHRRQP
jgi:hypothetical protein